MTRVERRYERVVSVAVAAVLATPFLFELITSGPLESPGGPGPAVTEQRAGTIELQ